MSIIPNIDNKLVVWQYFWYEKWLTNMLGQKITLVLITPESNMIVITDKKMDGQILDTFENKQIYLVTDINESENLIIFIVIDDNNNWMIVNNNDEIDKLKKTNDNSRILFIEAYNLLSINKRIDDFYDTYVIV